MKKFLSLVLALVMTMSLVTISAGAKDFTDDDSITYKEAVDVLSEIGVIDGYTDGSFGATGTLTRGAAAKIICNLILGPTTASALAADAAPFKDVAADHVFAGYIAYCAQQGIINGYADGTFRPAATLTGNHFMKMLLGALGYDGEIEGFTGGNWTIPVAKLALGAGLDDGLVEAFDGNKAVTREEACLYALNTIQATMVQYDSKSVITVGDVVIASSSKAEPVSQTGYKDIYESDKVDAQKTLQFGEKYFPRLTLKDGPDALGRKSNTWTFKNKEIGTYPTEDAILVYTSDMSSTSGKSEVKKALKGYDLTGAVVRFNGWYDEDEVGTTTNDIAEYTGNGILVEVYADGTDVTDVVVIDSYIAKVTKVNKTDETITVEFKDDTLGTLVTTVGYGEFEKDDYVMVSPVYSAIDTISKSDSKDDAVLVASEKFSGKVTTVSSSKVVLDGEDTYKFAEINSCGEPKMKDEIDVYTDAYGYAVYTSNVSAKDFVYAVTIYPVTDSYGDKVTYFQGVLTDGTVVEKKLDDESDAVVPGQLYSYKISGSKIKLTDAEVADGDNAHYVTYFNTQGTAGKIESSTKKLGNRYFADDTVFIAVDGEKSDLKVTIGTGKQLVKDGEAAYAIITAAEKKSTARADIAVVFVDTKSITNVKDLVLLADTDANGYETLKDTDYDTYEVYINGEKDSIPVDIEESDPEDGNWAKGNLFTYGLNEDGAYVLTRISEDEDVVENAAVTGVYKNWLTVTGVDNDDETLDAADATFVDLTSNGIEDMGTLKDVYDVKGSTITVTVVYNSDNEALIVYVIDATVRFLIDGANMTLVTTTETFVDGEDEIENPAYAEDGFDLDELSSISYKTGSKTNVLPDGVLTLAKTSKSVKVSTVDGYTFGAEKVEALD